MKFWLFFIDTTFLKQRLTLFNSHYLFFCIFDFTDGNKEQLRFNKNKMLTGPPEEVSLRPAANSMVFKQTNINPNLPLNNGKSIYSFLQTIIQTKNWLLE